MLRLERVVGNETDAELSPRIHALRHHGSVEYLFVPETDAGRRRLRLTTDRGTDCGVGLARNEQLRDGAVLYLDDERAIVVRLGAPKLLRLRPKSREIALRLGWNAGNLHWRVKFEGNDLVVILDGPREDYIARIAGLISDKSVRVDEAPR